MQYVQIKRAKVRIIFNIRKFTAYFVHFCLRFLPSTKKKVIFLQNYLVGSQKSSTFAAAFEKK